MIPPQRSGASYGEKSAYLDRYAVVPGTTDLAPDFFVDEVPQPGRRLSVAGEAR